MDLGETRMEYSGLEETLLLIYGIKKKHTLKVLDLKSMLNFVSNETPAFLLTSKRASEFQIVSSLDCFYS